jgi:hypothetical protein
MEYHMDKGFMLHHGIYNLNNPIKLFLKQGVLPPSQVICAYFHSFKFFSPWRAVWLLKQPTFSMWLLLSHKVWCHLNSYAYLWQFSFFFASVYGKWSLLRLLSMDFIHCSSQHLEVKCIACHYVVIKGCIS